MTFDDEQPCAWTRAGNQVELEALRLRVKAQRRELRRLNRTLGPYWAGFRNGAGFDRICRLRGKMIAAFGAEAVYEAENKE